MAPRQRAPDHRPRPRLSGAASAISLAHNYRCPPRGRRSLAAADRTQRGPLPKADRRRVRPPGGEPALRLHEHETQQHAAGEIASALAGGTREQIVVLARTTNLLRTVALACADLGVRIAAPEPVFEPAGARGAARGVRAAVRGAQSMPSPTTSRSCAARPSRGLPFGAEEQVASRLEPAAPFTESLAALAAGARQRVPARRRRASPRRAGRDHRRAPVRPLPARPRRARRVLRRARAGLRRAPSEIELEVLEQAQREAAARPLREYATLLQARSDALAAIRDDRTASS